MSTAAPSIGRFVWHDLMTTDVAAATSFYTSLFPEWTITAAPMEGGFDYYRIAAADGEVAGMLLLDAALGFPSHWIGYIAVEDCDAALARLEHLGGACVLPTMEFSGIGRMAIVHDAQGAHFKLFQRETPGDLPQRPAVGHFCRDELLTSDVAAAGTLYADLFGWQSVDQQIDGLGASAHFQQDGIDFASAITLPPAAEAPSNWLPYLAVDDADARAARAAELGGTTYVEPRDIPQVGRFSVHADPTGAAFAMLQRLER